MLHSRLKEKQDARLKYVEITVCLVANPRGRSGPDFDLRSECSRNTKAFDAKAPNGLVANH